MTKLGAVEERRLRSAAAKTNASSPCASAVSLPQSEFDIA